MIALVERRDWNAPKEGAEGKQNRAVSVRPLHVGQVLT